VFSHIKAYYGCSETTKNGIHSLLWLNDSLDPNTLVPMLCDNEGFRKHMIDYLNNIITKNMEQNKSTSKITHVNDEIQHVDPCTTRIIDTCMNAFDKLFQNDVCNLMNVCNQHVCNPIYYKINVHVLIKLCRYNSP
jgi:hypothetical protein